MEIRKQQKNNNDKLLKENPNKALLYEIERLNDSIIDLSVEVKKKDKLEYELILNGNDFKGKNGESIKGDKGKDGKDGKDGISPVKGVDYLTEKEVIAIKESITPIKGVDYFDGEHGDHGKDGEQGKQGIGIQGKKGEQGKPPKHEIKGNSIRFENPDGTWGRWIDLGTSGFGSSTKQKTLHRGGLDYIVEDLSSQCDGANMVFTTTNNFKSGTIFLSSTQFPIIYRKDIDFTETGTKEITLVAAQVGAPQEGQTLMCQYVKG